MPDVTPLPAAVPARMGSNAGQPITRRDGILKVTGAARYAADNHPAGLLHAVYAPATIARGRVSHLDVAAATAHPGVVAVITPENRPALMLDPDDQALPLRLPHRGAAERPRPLCRPADRAGRRRDAGGGDRGRRAAGAAL